MKKGLITNIVIVFFGLFCLIMSVVEYFLGHYDKATYLLVFAVLARVSVIEATPLKG